MYILFSRHRHYLLAKSERKGAKQIGLRRECTCRGAWCGAELPRCIPYLRSLDHELTAACK